MTATAEPSARAAWRDRIVGHGSESPEQLVANPRNWRIHPLAQRRALASVLDDVGWIGEVLVNRTTGNVVDGHLRVDLALERGEKAVPVKYVELTEEEEGLALASLDPIAAMAVTDETKLRELLAEVTVSSADLEKHLVAFAAAGRRADPVGDPDALPDIPTTTTYVEPGDLWLLGEHRLVCGDSSDGSVLERLLDGTKPSVVLTDPPYGINLDTDYSKITGSRNTEAVRAGKKRVIANTYDRVEGDDRAFDATFLSEQLAGAREQFWFGANYYRRTLPGDDRTGSWLVWDKRPSGWNDDGAGIDDVIGAGFELIWSRQRHQQRVLRYQWSGFTARNPGFVREHPTEKPVALLRELLERFAPNGETVIDPFGGGGTALIAAGLERRRAFLVEIDPRYCQVTIERWQQQTGQEARRG